MAEQYMAFSTVQASDTTVGYTALQTYWAQAEED